MSSEAQSLLNQWSPPLVLDALILLAAIFYFRGWLGLRRSSPGLIGSLRLVAFLTGMFALWFAIGSPLEAFDDVSLTVHMIQHLLLMVVVPPLVLIGFPALPLLHGLPRWFVRTPLGAVLRWRPITTLGRFLVHPIVSFTLATIAMIGWHVPAAFELALRSDFWHDMEHTCFLFTSILFWWPVILPFPSEARWPRWSVPVYLFFGMFPSSAVGAFLAFCERVLYPGYSDAPQLFRITPLADQILAGSLMWGVGGLVCIIPAVAITFQLLSPEGVEAAAPLPSELESSL
jgi:putative membrane protein